MSLNEKIETNKTKVQFKSYVWDEKKLHTGAGSDLDKVEMEDINNAIT